MELTPEQKAIVANNMRLARLASRRFAHKYRDLLDREEIEQVALLALMDAARTFDPNEGTPFAGYAWRRVQGSVIELARKETRARQLRKALGSYMEVATRQGSVLTDTSETVRQEAVEHAQYAQMALALGMLATEEEKADETFIREETKAVLIGAIDELDEERRNVIEQVYFEERTLKDVAASQGWTVITTRRRHKAALEDLCRALARVS